MHWGISKVERGGLFLGDGEENKSISLHTDYPHDHSCLIVAVFQVQRIFFYFN